MSHWQYNVSQTSSLWSLLLKYIIFIFTLFISLSISHTQPSLSFSQTCLQVCMVYWRTELVQALDNFMLFCVRIFVVLKRLPVWESAVHLPWVKLYTHICEFSQLILFLFNGLKSVLKIFEGRMKMMLTSMKPCVSYIFLF